MSEHLPGKEYLGQPGPATGTAAQFVSTRWSVILSAKDHASPEAQTALARLCEAYWYPIYAFLRRKGYGRSEAEDFTQGFFAHVLQREWLRNVGPDKGRFRTFVLRCLTNFVTNQPRLPATLPIDFSCAEERYGVEPTHEVTPARLFELRWAAALLDKAATRLRLDFAGTGATVRFDALFPYLTKETAPGAFVQVAVSLGISEVSARQEVSRMRKAYRDAIRSEIAETVSGREEIEDELQHLLRVLSH